MAKTSFDKKRFSQLLIKAMGNRNMSEYAHHAKISLTYLSELIRELRDNPPQPPTIKKLADRAHGNVTYKELMEAAGQGHLLDSVSQVSEETIPYGPTFKIPVLGTISAGLPLYAEQNIIEYVDVQANEVKGGEFFFLIVKGDSMIGSRIHPGDRVLVRKQEEVENGEIAVVMVGKEEATLKRVKYLEEAIILYPDNPKYQPQIYKDDEVKILGKVVKVEFKP